MEIMPPQRQRKIAPASRMGTSLIRIMGFCGIQGPVICGWQGIRHHFGKNMRPARSAPIIDPKRENRRKGMVQHLQSPNGCTFTSGRLSLMVAAGILWMDIKSLTGTLSSAGRLPYVHLHTAPWTTAIGMPASPSSLSQPERFLFFSEFSCCISRDNILGYRYESYVYNPAAHHCEEMPQVLCVVLLFRYRGC